MYSAHIYSSFIRISWSPADSMQCITPRWMLTGITKISISLAARLPPANGFTAHATTGFKARSWIGAYSSEIVPGLYPCLSRHRLPNAPMPRNSPSMAKRGGGSKFGTWRLPRTAPSAHYGSNRSPVISKLFYLVHRTTIRPRQAPASPSASHPKGLRGRVASLSSRERQLI